MALRMRLRLLLSDRFCLRAGATCPARVESTGPSGTLAARNACQT